MRYLSEREEKKCLMISFSLVNRQKCFDVLNKIDPVDKYSYVQVFLWVKSSFPCTLDGNKSFVIDENRLN